ncbi:thioredoxin family protein [Maribacter sp. 2308TA10-17]|uniref:thioredoxin family protein n=1 Tax=Maribacter sp. 2308TA10-17 TaxID=3386276 RepID=UPI0039BC675D
MKHLLLFLILPIFMSAQAEMEVVADSQWLTNYDSAISTAEKNDKNVLVYFTGSDWCPPCKMLKKDLFESAEFLALSDKYVLLYIDIPMNKDILTPEQLEHNKALSSKLNKKGSVPLLKILDKKGKELDKYSGYSMNGETRYHLDLIKKYQ